MRYALRLLALSLAVLTPGLVSGQGVAGRYVSTGPVQTTLTVYPNGTWETVMSQGHWAAQGRAVTMDGAMRGVCGGVGEISADRKTLSFMCKDAQGWPFGTTYRRLGDVDPSTPGHATGTGTTSGNTPTTGPTTTPTTGTPTGTTTGTTTTGSPTSTTGNHGGTGGSTPGTPTTRPGTPGTTPPSVPVSPVGPAPTTGGNTGGATTPRPYSSQPVAPVTSTPVRIDRATPVAPVTAQTVAPIGSTEVTPVRAHEITVNPPGGGTCQAEIPDGNFDRRLVGSWAMIVPGAAWSQETDRGAYVERVTHVSLAAAAGALSMAADGRYAWQKRAGTATGRLSWCTTNAGRSGVAVRYGQETFLATSATGADGGILLFSLRTGFVVYQGKAIR